MKKIVLLLAGLFSLSVARAALVEVGEHVGVSSDGSAVMCDTSNNAWNITINGGFVITEARRDTRGAVMKCLSPEAAKKKFGTPTTQKVLDMTQILTAAQDQSRAALEQSRAALLSSAGTQWDETGLRFVRKDDACTAAPHRLIFAVDSAAKLMYCRDQKWADAAPVVRQLQEVSDQMSKLQQALPRAYGGCTGIPVC